MNTMTETHVELGKLHPHPRNPRSKKTYEKKNPKMAELVLSVTAAGVWSPLIVRPLPTNTEEFQILAGHRRFNAAKHAKLVDVPVVIRNYSDEEAIALLLADNPQHEDIDPFEEARILRILIDDQNQSHDQIAAWYGKPLSWVVRRARLARLCEKALNFIEDEYPSWTVGHMELIARYDDDQQMAMLDTIGWNGEELTIQDLDRKLRSSHRDLTKALWDLNDADLVPKAGACAVCTKRSSCHLTLFPEVVEKPKRGTASPVTDSCLDESCWEKKVAAQLTVREAELSKKHPTLIRVSSDYQGEDKTVVYNSAWKRGKRSDPDAKPAVIVDRHTPGSFCWVVPAGNNKPAALKRGSVTGESGTVGEADLRKELTEKREALQKRRTILSYRYLEHALHSIEPKSPIDMADFMKSIHDEEPIVIEDDEDTFEDDIDDKDSGFEWEDGKPKGDSTEFTDFPMEPKVPSLSAVIAWAYVHGTRHGCRYYGYASGKLQEFDLIRSITETTDQDRLRDLIWEAVWPVMKDKMRFVIAQRDNKDEGPKTIAALLGIDLDKIQAHANQVITEPKAWAKHYASILEVAA